MADSSAGYRWTKWASRRLVFALLVVVEAGLLLWCGKVSGDVYGSVVTVTVASYLGARAVESVGAAVGRRGNG